MLTCRVPGLAVLVFRGDRAKDAADRSPAEFLAAADEELLRELTERARAGGLHSAAAHAPETQQGGTRFTWAGVRFTWAGVRFT